MVPPPDPLLRRTVPLGWHMGSRRAKPGSARRWVRHLVFDEAFVNLPLWRSATTTRATPLDEDDVPELVAACNDPEIPRWIPFIPSPYTEADALDFIRGESRPDIDHSFAMTLEGDWRDRSG